MVYNSLTDAPRNLKEAIDWLLALKGTEAENNFNAMASAVYDFLADKPVGRIKVRALEKVKSISHKFMGQKALKEHSFVKIMLRRFESEMSTKFSLFHRHFGSLAQSDCENVIEATGVKPEDIAVELAKAVDGCEKFLDDVKIPGQYSSAYSSRATWDSSCSRKPEACAVVLVGIAPMLYAGLRSLKEASADVVNRQWLVSYAEMHLKDVLKAVGYKTQEYRASMSGADISTALNSVKYDMLSSIYDLAGFWAFYGFDKIGDLKVEQPKDPKADPSVEGEGKQPVIPEAEPSVYGEGEQSVIPEAEPSFEGEGEQSVIPEAEPSVEPVQPEVDDVEQPVKVAKAAKVARSVKAAKKAAKKVSRKARQKKEKKQQESAEH
ncbi:hypothetical protein BBBOND_0109120 [Babesia bigemina]|uniref:Uncharacterized protein n=1 Tax=Babesia bigemina TaxID=5866 RepID=A0A061D6P1_BABBI|nr:hypothetical protein BBBOND_0109120 [Babesia bigemina]CDR94614.1 hypothetical protein BBBOND_0109120 [Babesia bigemina]|eukprot:XP_012766800.1 hypothetical protein BBBOND_0109120 [Babesia bigemina]